MPTYPELTDTVAQQFQTALKRLQNAQTAVLAPWIRTATGLIPSVDVPFVDRLPSPKEVVDANFRLTGRALDAQRDYVVGLVETATAESKTPHRGTQQKSTSAKSTSAKK